MCNGHALMAVTTARPINGSSLVNGNVKMRLTPAVKQNITKLLDIKAMQHMDSLSRYNLSQLTMQQLVKFGNTATEPDSFHFIKKEVPMLPSVINLKQWYTQSFIELCTFEGLGGHRDDLKDYVNTPTRQAPRQHRSDHGVGRDRALRVA